MNQSIHLIITPTDELIPVMGQPDVVGPMLQIYNADMVGGPVSISFGDLNKPDEGVVIVDGLISALVRIRAELRARSDERLQADRSRLGLLPRVFDGPLGKDWPVDHAEGE